MIHEGGFGVPDFMSQILGQRTRFQPAAYFAGAHLPSEFKRREPRRLLGADVAAFAFLLQDGSRHGSEEVPVPAGAQLGPVAVALHVLVVISQVDRIEVDVVHHPRRVFGGEERGVMADLMLDLGEGCAFDGEFALVAVIVRNLAHDWSVLRR